MQLARKLLVTAVMSMLLSAALAAQARGPVEGTWIGTASSDDSATKLIVEFSNDQGVLKGSLRRDPDGADDSFDLEDLEFKNGRLFFTYSESEGLTDMTSVDLKLDGDRLEGVWRDSEGGSGPVKLVRKTVT